MKSFNYKALLPHLLIVVLFAALTYIFFTPLLSGKKLRQQDMMNTKGMGHELELYKQKTGEYALWTNSMFSGMPAYQITMPPSPNIFHKLFHFLRFGLPYDSTGILFMYLLCFYIMCIALGVNMWLAIAGSIAFSFASYNIIIVEVGHITKAYAIAFIPLVFAGFWLLLQNKRLLGLLLFTIGLGLQITSSHVQITYYTLLMLAVFGVVYAGFAIKEKRIKDLAINVGLIVLGTILAILPSASNLITTYEAGRYSIRGGSELSTADENQKKGGLDKDYAFSWSYGKVETGTLLIPNFVGGSGAEDIGSKSETVKILKQNSPDNAAAFEKNAPLYWGDQPFTAGPTYFGAIVVLLFFLGVFLIEGPLKWGLIAATLMSIIIAWGRNFFLNDIFFDIIPYYNKFRTVSMALVIAGFTMPALGFLALREWLDDKVTTAKKMSALKKAAIAVGGFCLLFTIAPGMFFDFSSSTDAQQKFPDWLIQALQADRQSALQADAMRSLFFVVATLALLWATLTKKITYTILYVGLGLLMLIDLVPIGKRYLTKEDFDSKQAVAQVYEPDAADLEILKDTDPDFRVFNTTRNPFTDGRTSYFHKSIGGYHGAKLRRYQELYEATVAKGNMQVLNMLNAKYFIVQNQQTGQPMAQLNPQALGNAWFVSDYKVVNNADEELKALEKFDPKTTAIVAKDFASVLGNLPVSIPQDSLNANAIKLVNYKPDGIKYESNVDKDRLAIFSEVYFPEGWNAYIDGQLKPHLRANYVLRAMVVPQGKHTIEFKFEPTIIKTGYTLSMTGSVLVVVLIVTIIVLLLKRKND